MQVSLGTFRRSRAAARVALVVCIAGALGIGSTALAQSPAASPRYATTKAGFGIAPGAGFFLDNANLTRGLDDFKALGVHWIRSSMQWKAFEPVDPATLAPGVSPWNWRAVDALVATLHRPAYNGLFSLIVDFDAPPAWATKRSRIAPISCAIQAPFDLQAYATAAAALAQHLEGTATVFEIQNSPNIGQNSAAHDYSLGVWPVPNPCGYAQLLKLTTPAVHAANPNATVLVGGIGGNKDMPGQRMAADTFLTELYANGAQGSFDGVSYHPYSTPNLPCAPSAPACTYDPTFAPKANPYGMSNGWDRMLHARDIMIANGDTDKKMWITEYGAPTDGKAGHALTQTQQAALLTAGFNRASQYPWVAEMCWFTYQDIAGANPATSPNGDWMGLVNPNYTHKLAFATYRNLTAIAR